MYYVLEKIWEVTQLRFPSVCNGTSLTPKSLSPTSRSVPNSSWFQVIQIPLARESLGVCWCHPAAAAVPGGALVPHLTEKVWVRDHDASWEIPFSHPWHFQTSTAQSVSVLTPTSVPLEEAISFLNKTCSGRQKQHVRVRERGKKKKRQGN